MKKSIFAVFFLYLYVLLFTQTINVTFPTDIDSFAGQTLNIPIICENISQQSLIVYPDYFSTFHSDQYFYRLNKVSPRVVLPGSRELVFLSLTPLDDLIAGKRFFPFTIKDDRDRVLFRDVVQINHIVNEDFAIIPLNDFRYVDPTVNTGLSFLFANKGSVPIEFKVLVKGNQVSRSSTETSIYNEKIIYPSHADTLFISFFDIPHIVQTDYWISSTIDCTITKILPNELKVENLTLRSVFPIVKKSSYPFQREYYRLPIFISQNFMYHESMYAHRNIIRHYTTNVYGSGFIDEYPSSYLNFLLNYRYIDYDFKSDSDVFLNLNYRTSHLNIALGENSYVLDLKRFQKYGRGLEIGYLHRGVFFERVFLQELYGQKAIHNRTSLGYTWEQNSFLFEPDQYVRFHYYHKNNKDLDGHWIGEVDKKDDFDSLFNRWFANYEHQKFILEAQMRLLQNVRLHAEVYTVKEKDTSDVSPLVYSTELSFYSKEFMNRFSMLYDDVNTINESPKKIHLNNEFNVEYSFLDVYTNFRYRDEYTQPGYNFTSKYISHNISVNAFSAITKDLYLRYRFFDTALNFKSYVSTKFTENEHFYGLLHKKNYSEFELLYGIRKEKLDEYPTSYENIITFNTWLSNWNFINLNLFAYNKAAFDKHKFNFTNQINVFYRWTAFLHQSLGTHYAVYSEENWRNSLLLFTNLYYTFPWKHQLSFGGSYNINPSFSDMYRYSISTEYSMPLNARLLPKSNKKYMTLTFLDHWQRKPVSGVVLEMDSKYFVSNEAGIIRTKREDFDPATLKIINLPIEMTLSPDLSTLLEYKKHSATFRFSDYGRVYIKFKKLSYERISPLNIDAFVNVGYYNDVLINLDRYTIDDYEDSLEIMLRNIDNNAIVQRAILNNRGEVIFSGLIEGNYEILINDSSVTDDLIIDERENIFQINFGEKLEKELIVEERYDIFLRF